MISGLERNFRHADFRDQARRLHLAAPVHDVSILVYHVEVKLAMRIGPHEFRHDALQRDGIFQIVLSQPNPFSESEAAPEGSRACGHQDAQILGLLGACCMNKLLGCLFALAVLVMAGLLVYGHHGYALRVSQSDINDC